MTPVRRLLALPPFILLLLLCDTWVDVLPMMVGGLFITIPYLLAWWLSDGFTNFKRASGNKHQPHNFDNFSTHGNDLHGYEITKHNSGLYSPMYGKPHKHKNW